MTAYPLDDAIEMFAAARSEFELRAAVSRAYYVALTHMMDVAHAHGFEESRQRTDHQRIFEFFSQHSEKNLRRMGSMKLQQLYDARVAADYDYDHDFAVPHAREALMDAVDICARVSLKGIPPKTTYKTADLETIGTKSSNLPKKDPLVVLEELSNQTPSVERCQGLISQSYLYYFRHMRKFADKLGYESSAKGADHKRLRRFYEDSQDDVLTAYGSEKFKKLHQYRIKADYHPEELEITAKLVRSIVVEIEQACRMKLPLERADHYAQKMDVSDHNQKKTSSKGKRRKLVERRKMSKHQLR